MCLHLKPARKSSLRHPKLSPTTTIWPPVGLSIPAIRLRNVVFPGPESPPMTTISPSRTSRFTLFRTSTRASPVPYVLLREEATTIVSVLAIFLLSFRKNHVSTVALKNSHFVLKSAFFVISPWNLSEDPFLTQMRRHNGVLVYVRRRDQFVQKSEQFIDLQLRK